MCNSAPEGWALQSASRLGSRRGANTGALEMATLGLGYGFLLIGDLVGYRFPFFLVNKCGTNSADIRKSARELWFVGRCLCSLGLVPVLPVTPGLVLHAPLKEGSPRRRRDGRDGMGKSRNHPRPRWRNRGGKDETPGKDPSHVPTTNATCSLKYVHLSQRGTKILPITCMSGGQVQAVDADAQARTPFDRGWW